MARIKSHAKFFELTREEQRVELERTWRGDPERIGPVGPPMLLAMRQPDYNERLLNGTWLKPADPPPPPTAPPEPPSPIGTQYELAL